MAAILGDLLQITDFQNYLGQMVLNVFYYRVTNVTGLSNPQYETMLEWFRDEVQAPIRVEQNDSLTHTYLELRNLSNNVDIASLVVNESGDLGASANDLVPSYVSLGFKLVRESLVTRNGYKRIAGLYDPSILGNVYSFQTGSRAAIEAALAMDWVDGVITQAEPVIVKRPIDAPVGTSYEYSSIGSAIFTQLGTQNTRKAGRGI